MSGKGGKGSGSGKGGKGSGSMSGESYSASSLLSFSELFDRLGFC